MGLGKRKNSLAFWRRVRGLSQEDLGRLVGVCSRTIWSWENDTSMPTKAQAERMARLLRTNIRELFPFEVF